MGEVSRYSVVVLGSSLGGVEALQVVLGSLRSDIGVPVLVVQHLGSQVTRLASVLSRVSRLPISWAEDGAPAVAGRVHLCPGRSSMRLEPDGTLSVAGHARPSAFSTVDELFASAADALGAGVLAVVLTGAGRDGLEGARTVKDAGGTVLVQDELTSLAFGMPGAVAAAGLADLVVPLGEIPELIDAAVGRGERLPLPQVLAAETVFAAGGEMGALMAATDWSRSTLGPVEKWPTILRTTLATVLAAHVPMDLLWGREMVQLYNDAYRGLSGDKHPGMLGQPVQVSWAEAAAQFGPVLDEVWRTGRGRLLRDREFTVDRRGFVEQVTATISYSPVREDGEIVGILATLTETTAQVAANRRLNTLQRLAAGTGEDPDNEQVACARMAEALGENRHDVAFALIYLTDRTGTELHLAGAAGVQSGSVVAPRRLRLDEGSAWPVGGVLRMREPVVVDDLHVRFPGWTLAEEPAPARAVVLPAGRRDDGAVPAVLVLGAGRSVPFDEGHRAFCGLVAEQVGAGVLAARRRREVQERTAALAALNQAKDEFFAGVSHEFRTPLTLMLLPLEQLLASDLRPEQAEAAKLVHRNALRLLKLVNTLLEFARIGQGASRARVVDVDLAQLTVDVASVFRSAVEDAGLRYVVDCPPLGRSVLVDPEMWERVVLNLVSNALKHTFTGTITVSLRLRPNHVELQVVDTGVGIDPGEIPHLFRRFHRVRGARSRSHEGSGIGLALVQELVRLHRGSVRVRSKPAEGTTFTVWLPLVQRRTAPDQEEPGGETELRGLVRDAFVEEARLWLDGGEAVPAEIQDAPTPFPALPGRRYVVLLVDDNPDLRAYLRRLLDDRYEVLAAADGAQALEALAARPVDLVLTDAVMPRLDGLALLAAIRTDPALRHVPVIVLTAVADPDAAVAALAAGAHDYVVKPFTARELVARIEAQLALARGRVGPSRD